MNELRINVYIVLGDEQVEEPYPYKQMETEDLTFDEQFIGWRCGRIDSSKTTVEDICHLNSRPYGGYKVSVTLLKLEDGEEKKRRYIPLIIVPKH